MFPYGRAETCSCEIWLKMHFINCLTESCIRLYILLYINYQLDALIIKLFIKYEGWNFNSGNYLFTTDTK